MVHHVVVGVLLSAGRVLLTERSPTRAAHPGRWALPGGHVEDGESEGVALDRELHEELGITVTARASAPLARLVVPAAAPREELRLSTWRVDAWQGVPTNLLPDEHRAVEWLELEELDGLAWAHAEEHALVRSLLAADSSTGPFST